MPVLQPVIIMAGRQSGHLTCHCLSMPRRLKPMKSTIKAHMLRHALRGEPWMVSFMHLSLEHPCLAAVLPKLQPCTCMCRRALQVLHGLPSPAIVAARIRGQATDRMTFSRDRCSIARHDGSPVGGLSRLDVRKSL